MADYTVAAATRNAGTAITQQAAQANADINTTSTDISKLVVRIYNPEATSCKVTFGTGSNGLVKTLVTQTIAQNGIYVFTFDSDAVSLSTRKINLLVTGTDGGAYGGTIANIKLDIFAVPA